MFDNTYLKKLILPIIIEQILAVTIGIVDMLVISTVSQSALTGVALIENINRLIIQIMAGFSMGGIAVCSLYFGKKDEETAKKVCAQLELIMLIFSVLMMLICIIGNKALISLIFGNIDNDVMKSAQTFLVISALSYPFLGIYNAGAAIFRSSGNSKISMQLSFLMNIINLCLNMMFVFLFHLEVLGVATASLISRALSGIIISYLVCSPKNPIQIKGIRVFRPKIDLIKKILNIAVPSGIENGMFQIGKLAVVSMIAVLGTDAIAANAVGYTIIDFPNIPGVAIGLALITVVGQCRGAGEYEQVYKYTRKLLKYAYLGDWLCKFILFIFAKEIVSLFSLSVDATNTAVLILRCFSVASIVIWPLSFTLPNALRAMGDAKFTMTVSIVSMWIFRVISSYILAIVFKMGVLGLWIGMFIDWYFRGIIFSVRFFARKKKNL